jgi:hypothetical protein
VFFVWSAVLRKILTLDNLRKKHVIVINRCYMCKKDGESVDHLLLHCKVAHELRCNIFSRLGLSWSCLVVFWTCVLVGVPLAGLGVPWLGKWCLFVFFGLFGGKETMGVLRTWKALWKRS